MLQRVGEERIALGQALAVQQFGMEAACHPGRQIALGSTLDAVNERIRQAMTAGDPSAVEELVKQQYEPATKAFYDKFHGKYGIHPKEHEVEGYAAIYIIDSPRPDRCDP